MKKYIGTKVIMAKPMTRGDYNIYRGWTIPENENPNDEGYLVKYSDDYESWSPKAAFDSAYRSFDGGMSFGHAIELMKMGFKLKRKGWNGKNLFDYQNNSYYTAATIKEVINTKNITDRYAVIETAVDFSKLETVLVIIN